MGQSTDEIEAKLAAFVDGDLDAAGREEIERHLEVNPQHRKLLDDLMRGRELLRDLPRESAPPEILDSIQSHLERRLLLDEHAHEPGSTAGSSGIRRFMAIAAVLLLTGTLALVIYSVLPNSKIGSDLAAVLERAETPTAELVPPAAAPETRVARSDASSTPADAATRDRAVASAVEAIRGAADGTMLAGGGPSRSEPDLGHPSVASVPTVPPSAEEAAPGFSPVIVLATDDRSGTEKELVSVLNEQRVAYEQVASPVSAARRVAEAASTAGAEGESIFVARKLTRSQYQAIDQALNAPARARKQAVEPTAKEQYLAFGRSKVEGQDSFRELDKDKPAEHRADAKPDSGNAGEGKASAALSDAGAPRQASNGEQAQSVDRLAPGDKLSIELPGMLQSNVSGGQTVEVAPDGSLQVAPLEPIPAAGLTVDEVTQKLRTMVGAKNGTAAGVSVQRQPAKSLADDNESLMDVVIVVRSGGETDSRAAGGSTERSAAAALAGPSPATTAPVGAAPAEPAPAESEPATTPQPTTAPATQPGN